MAGGRPSSFTQEVIRKLEYAFAIDCTVTEACLYAGISTPTFYDNAPPDSQLFNRFMALRDKPVLAAKETIRKNLHKEDTAKWLLERKRKGDYSLRFEQTGKDGEALIPKPIMSVLRDDSNNQNQEPKKEN